ncbi:hypothetical protein [Chryseoglobus sp. 28M-23]|uniref:FMN-binding protein n=1 Tax=Chryseoglobus sp. 28M-23 TaxID=2772253 RepID=UPI0017467ADF|nr:hypothetical protein [Chryseoglobus sp. 28M-23]QOD93946.1 hypothetical protein IE160_01520 [Chryseoglobus sp. 28M-23]
MTRTTHPAALPMYATAAGLTLLGTLAGCADAGATAGGTTPGDTSASYADGSYQANGTYTSPNGSENIIVAVTLEDDVVTEVEVTTNPNNPTTEFYQSAFAEGIAAEAVGVDIDLLDVTRVSGSSLTSGGFREAIASIKADALEG